MSKFISFSLFGTDPVYNQGALRNVELAAKFYPGWVCVFFTSTNLPTLLHKELLTRNAFVYRGRSKNEMFQRFEITDDPTVERFIVRDCDSRLSEREAHAVAAWEASGLPFHSMRDHPHHTLPMGGGLWGAMGGAIKDMRALITASGLASTPYVRQSHYGADQTFLSRHIWPLAKHQCLQHDSCTRHLYPDAEPFPDGCKLGEWRFCGEVVDAQDVPHPRQWQQRISYMTP